MGQTSPCRFKMPQSLGSTFSMPRSPMAAACLASVSIGIGSKHQESTDCLMRPLVTTRPAAAAASAHGSAPRAAAPPAKTAAVVPAWSISRRVRRFDRLLMARASWFYAEMFNSANVSRSHFSDRSIIGPPCPSHSMLNTPS